MTMLFK